MAVPGRNRCIFGDALLVYLIALDTNHIKSNSVAACLVAVVARRRRTPLEIARHGRLRASLHTTQSVTKKGLLEELFLRRIAS